MSDSASNRPWRSLSRPLHDEEEAAALTPAVRARAAAQEDALVAQILTQRAREQRRGRWLLPTTLAAALAAALVMLWLPTPVELPPYRLEPQTTVLVLGGPTEPQGQVIRLTSEQRLTFKLLPERSVSTPLEVRCYVKRDGERAQPWPVKLAAREGGAFELSGKVRELPLLGATGGSYQVAVVLAPPGEHPGLEVVDGVLSGAAPPMKRWQIVYQRYEIIDTTAAGAAPEAGSAARTTAPPRPAP